MLNKQQDSTLRWWFNQLLIIIGKTTYMSVTSDFKNDSKYATL